MKQDDLISKIASDAGVTKVQAGQVLQSLGATVQKALAAGDEVTVPGIGKLSVNTRAARTGRNPRTGEEIAIAAKKVPHFSAIKVLKDAVA